MPVATIPTIMKKFNHSKIHVLKIDCEGCEIPVLEHLRRYAPSVLDDVDQILMELHLSTSLGMRNVASINMMVDVFHHIMKEKNFRLFHKSFNDGFPWDQEVNPSLLLSGFPPKTCCIELNLVSARFVQISGFFLHYSLLLSFFA